MESMKPIIDVLRERGEESGPRFRYPQVLMRPWAITHRKNGRH